MSTRSRIALLQEDGQVKSIYCHWDGYPSYNGKMLLQHYNSKPLVEALLNMGDMSSLDATIEECTFYARDRGEEDVAAVVEPMEQFKQDIVDDIFEEFTYLFRDGEWVCFVGSSTKEVPIEDAIKQDSGVEV